MRWHAQSCILVMLVLAPVLLCDGCDTCSNCQNDSSCMGESADGALCVCRAGFDGSCCEMDLCDPNPCRNGGSCIRHQNGIICDCPAGYSGNRCETDIDNCSPNPCHNGGTCEDGVNTFTCSCPSTFVGRKCEVHKSATQPIDETEEQKGLLKKTWVWITVLISVVFGCLFRIYRQRMLRKQKFRKQVRAVAAVNRIAALHVAGKFQKEKAEAASSLLMRVAALAQSDDYKSNAKVAQYAVPNDFFDLVKRMEGSTSDYRQDQERLLAEQQSQLTAHPIEPLEPVLSLEQLSHQATAGDSENEESQTDTKPVDPLDEIPSIPEHGLAIPEHPIIISEEPAPEVSEAAKLLQQELSISEMASSVTAAKYWLAIHREERLCWNPETQQWEEGHAVAGQETADPNIVVQEEPSQYDKIVGEDQGGWTEHFESQEWAPEDGEELWAAYPEATLQENFEMDLVGEDYGAFEDELDQIAVHPIEEEDLQFTIAKSEAQ